MSVWRWRTNAGWWTPGRGARRRVLITGTSTGIGRELAREMAGVGWHVVATARRVETLADLPVADRLELDVTDRSSIAAAVAAAGPVDVLVNNAGVGIYGASEHVSMEDVGRLFDVNVLGALRVTQAVLPACGLGAGAWSSTCRRSQRGGRCRSPGSTRPARPRSRGGARRCATSCSVPVSPS